MGLRSVRPGGSARPSYSKGLSNGLPDLMGWFVPLFLGPHGPLKLGPVTFWRECAALSWPQDYLLTMRRYAPPECKPPQLFQCLGPMLPIKLPNYYLEPSQRFYRADQP